MRSLADALMCTAESTPLLIAGPLRWVCEALWHVITYGQFSSANSESFGRRHTHLLQAILVY